MTDAASVRVNPEKTSLSVEYQHDRPLTCCHWEPASRYVFFGAEDNFVHRFDRSNQTAVSWPAHASWVRSFGSSPDGDALYSGGYDGRIAFWSTAAEEAAPLRIVDAHRGWVRALAVSPDGRYLASCGNDLLIKLWDAAAGSLIRQFAGHQSHVYNLVFLPDGLSIVSCDLKGVVMLWSLDSESPRELVRVEALHKYDAGFKADIGGARCIALRDDGAQVALGGITNVTNAFAGVGEVAVALVNVAEGKLDLLLETKDKLGGTAWGIAYHPGGFWIGLSGGGGGGWILFWKGDAPHEIFKLKLKSDGRGMSMSGDHSRLAVAHADRHLRTYTIDG